jgi:thermostable 8-oxoguanine DNA glycosylase
MPLDYVTRKPMKIKWKIVQSDIRSIHDIVNTFRDHPMMSRRIERNLSDSKPAVSRERFWKALASALLTTQQKSGPNSPVSRLINFRPFPLNYRSCVEAKSLGQLISKTLSEFGGIRRYETISTELVENLTNFQNGLWSELKFKLMPLYGATTRETECVAADYLDENLKGLGPKQARNVLQGLGLTRYEIPIDSRITKWLNKLPFPIHLGSTALSDRDYYGFVMDGIEALCEASEVYPCIFDAAVFVSYDGGGWNQRNVIW